MDYETPQFYRVIQYAQNADRDVVDMVSGSPDWDPPDGLREGFREYADRDPAAFQYGASEGIPDLREAIAERRDVDPERVLITNGAGEANHLAMAGALDVAAGSAFVLADPYYPYYAGRANFLDAETTVVPVDDDGHLEPAAVRAAASEQTGAIVVNTPNNPTGAVYGEETMAALADVAEARDAVLLSDEVYDRFDYSDRFASALGTDSPNAVVTNAFSKSMAATGARVGYAIYPDSGLGAELHEAARTRHMLSNVTGSRPAQFAVARALETTGPEYYADARRRVADRIDTFCEALADLGVEHTRPEGGFYVLASFEDYPGTMDAVERMIDEVGVAGMPGAVFGRARRDCIRFSMSTGRVETAVERLRAALG